MSVGSALGSHNIVQHVMDALDVGVLVVDNELRILVINAAARTLVPTSRDHIEDARLCRLLRALATSPSNTASWTDSRGQRVLLQGKPLAPDGLLVTLGRERVSENDLVHAMRGKLGLTVRQQKIVLLVRDGLSNRAIANELGVSEATVKACLTVVFRAFDVGSRTALLAAVERLRSVK